MLTHMLVSVVSGTSPPSLSLPVPNPEAAQKSEPVPVDPVEVAQMSGLTPVENPMKARFPDLWNNADISGSVDPCGLVMKFVVLGPVCLLSGIYRSDRLAPSFRHRGHFPPSPVPSPIHHTLSI